MKVNKSQNEANRAALLEAGERLFKENGFDGVGVVDISKAAGLTHGAFYAHFESKAALAVEACRASQESAAQALLDQRGVGKDDLAAFLDFYILESGPGPVGEGCPMAAYATEIVRQPEAVQRRFAEGVNKVVGILESALSTALPKAQAHSRALAMVAGMVGSVALSRACKQTMPDLSRDLLQAVRDELLACGKEGTQSRPVLPKKTGSNRRKKA